MKLEDVHPLYRMVFIVYEAYRKLGIPSDDIHIGYDEIQNAVPVSELLYVRAEQGPLEFVFTVGAMPGLTRQQMFAELEEARAAWVDPANTELATQMWDESIFMKTSMGRQLVFAMINKGFHFVSSELN